MKSKFSILIVAITVLAPLGVVAQLALQQSQQAQPQEHIRYKLVVIGTFGGPNSYPFDGDAKALSNRGMLTGQADTAIPDPNFANFNPYVGQNPFLQHAFKWQNGKLADLGALPGSNTSNAGWITEGGAVSGLSTRSTLDPLTGWPEEAAILWTQNGEIIDLGTLGGYEAQADANNSRGQVAGFSSNNVPDSLPSPICGCIPGYGMQQRAFLWQNGEMRDLGDLGGPDAVALLINERGQIAGQSYTSYNPNPATGIPTIDPFIWESGNMVDVGSFGGTIGGASWLNNRGQVVGFSNLPGDVTMHPYLWDRGLLTDLGTLGGTFGVANHANDTGQVVGYAATQGDQAVYAFLWEDGVMASLGALDSDRCSTASHINSRELIVGTSSPGCTFNPGDQFGFLWQNGQMINLNVFVPSGVGITLAEPGWISDRGEIAGKGPLANGDVRAFLLVPCGEGEEGCIDAATAPLINRAVTSTRPAARPTGLSDWRAGGAKRYPSPSTGAQP
jgi:probable HAF family extracellular repeat protein